MMLVGRHTKISIISEKNKHFKNDNFVNGISIISGSYSTFLNMLYSQKLKFSDDEDDDKGKDSRSKTRSKTQPAMKASDKLSEKKDTNDKENEFKNSKVSEFGFNYSIKFSNKTKKRYIFIYLFIFFQRFPSGKFERSREIILDRSKKFGNEERVANAQVYNSSNRSSHRTLSSTYSRMLIK